MTAVPFPILRLPQRSLQKCLKQMSEVEHVSLAILSENASKQIGKLQLRLYGSRIPGVSSMWTYLKQYYFQFLMYDHKHVQILLRLHELANKNLAEIHDETIFRSGNSIKVLYEYIKDLRITELVLDSSETQDYQLLKMFPSLEELSVYDGSINNSIFPHNLERLNLYSIKVTLDDILLLNCSRFSIDHAFSEKEMNTFLKHWIRGCIPRLRNFSFYSGESHELEERLEIPFVKTVLFEGIQYKEVNYCVGNAFETERYDGTKAYVWFETTGFTFLLHGCFN